MFVSSRYYSYQEATKGILSVFLGEDLGGAAFSGARAATTTSFYTPPDLIRSIWEGIERSGFSGGRILDPGAGTGLFLGFAPEGIRERSSFFLVEKDPSTAMILKSLYGDDPNVRIFEGGFEEAPLPKNRFDLVVGNFPFGDVFLPAKLDSYPHKRAKIHDYFLFKSAESLREGGMLSVITTTGFMDQTNGAIRRAIAKSGAMSLASAVRLPGNVFTHSGTSVVSDVLTMVKGEIPEALPFFSVGSHSVDGAEIAVNDAFFSGSPSVAVLGDFKKGTNQYGRTVLDVANGRNWKERLPEIVSAYPENLLDRKAPETESNADVALLSRHPVGSFLVKEGVVFFVDEDRTEVPFSGTPRESRMVAQAVLLRETLQTLIDTDRDAASTETQSAGARKALNDVYDSFVAEYGPVSSDSVRKVMRQDPSYALLLALEDYSEDLNVASKARIFFERTIRPNPLPPERVETPLEALLTSLDFRGKIDPAFMESLMEGMPFEEIAQALSGRLFRQADGSWETSERYLSGNVREKLDEAKKLAAEDPAFQENVAALESVLPPDLLPSQIHIALGASWIPEDDIREFVEDMMSDVSGRRIRLKKGEFLVSYQGASDTWTVTVMDRVRKSVNEEMREWGVPPKKGFIDLLDCALNGRTPVISSSGEESEDESENDDLGFSLTERARDIIVRIREKFSAWVWQDPERSQRYVTEYNNRFNVWVPPVYSGEHLSLPGLSADFKPHKHQRDAVWRILSGGGENTLLAHEVGLGKTAEMIMAAHELVRVGGGRAAIIVPNHMLRQVTAEAQRLYPAETGIMAVSKEDLDKKNRRLFVGRIVTGNAKIVIMTHGVFERIRLSPAKESEILFDIVENLRYELAAEASLPDEEKASATERRSRDRSVKRIEKLISKYETKIKSLLSLEKKDSPVSFESLGITRLFVDEAHYFKGIETVTKMSEIPGVTGQGSGRGMDLFMKTRYLIEQNGGEKGVYFATGTPVANIMAELYNMMRFLRPSGLEKMGISSFDQWAKQFGIVVTSWNPAPEGGFRREARFSKYVNLGELISFYRSFADVKTKEESGLVLPQARMETITAPMSPLQKKMQGAIALRAQRVRGGGIDPAADNMLKVLTDARKMALDPRLLDPLFPEDPNSKIAAMIGKVAEIYHNPDLAGKTQVIFCDYGTPGESRAYSVYAFVKERLVEAGIRPEEVAFVHEAETDDEKEALFRRVREGEIRVLLGSTGKMGVGTNIQSRLVALHMLDLPWRPADVEQRIGRIVRQGNTNEQVHIFVYTAEESVDVFMLGALNRKAEFIKQLMDGKVTDRTMTEDTEDMAYDHIMAASSGSAYVREKIEVSDEVARVERKQKAWVDARYSAERRLRQVADDIGTAQFSLTRLESESDFVAPENADDWILSIGEEESLVIGKSEEEDARIASLFINAYAAASPGDVVARYGEFRLVKSPSQFSLHVARHSVHAMNFGDLSIRTFSRLRTFVGSFEKSRKALILDLHDLSERKAKLEAIIAAPFEDAATLASLKEREKTLMALIDEEAERLRLERSKQKRDNKDVDLILSGSGREALLKHLETVARLNPAPETVRLVHEPETGRVVLEAWKGNTAIWQAPIIEALDEGMLSGDPTRVTVFIRDLQGAREALAALGDSGLCRLTNLLTTREMVLTVPYGQCPAPWFSVTAEGVSPAVSPVDAVSAPAVSADLLSKTIDRVLGFVGTDRPIEKRVLKVVPGKETTRFIGTDGSRMVWAEIPGVLSGSAFSLGAGDAGKIASFCRDRKAVPDVDLISGGVTVSIARETVTVPLANFPGDEAKVLGFKGPSVSLPSQEIREFVGAVQEERLRVSGVPGGVEISGGERTCRLDAPEGETIPAFWVRKQTFSEIVALGEETLSVSIARLPEGHILPFYGLSSGGSEVLVLSMPLAKSADFEAEFQKKRAEASRIEEEIRTLARKMERLDAPEPEEASTLSMR